MNDLDCEILIFYRGMTVRQASAYDNCTQQACADALARVLWRQGDRPSPASGGINESHGDPMAQREVSARLGVDHRLWANAWNAQQKRVAIRAEARKRARTHVAR